jgi:hypothetical protein
MARQGHVGLGMRPLARRPQSADGFPVYLLAWTSTTWLVLTIGDPLGVVFPLDPDLAMPLVVPAHQLMAAMWAVFVVPSPAAQRPVVMASAWPVVMRWTQRPAPRLAGGQRILSERWSRDMHAVSFVGRGLRLAGGPRASCRKAASPNSRSRCVLRGRVGSTLLWPMAVHGRVARSVPPLLLVVGQHRAQPRRGAARRPVAGHLERWPDVYVALAGRVDVGVVAGIGLAGRCGLPSSVGSGLASSGQRLARRTHPWHGRH